MRTMAEVQAHGRPGHAFSNGFEFDAWRGNWCDRCTYDTDRKGNDRPPAHKGDPAGCPILNAAWLGDPQIIPAEWLEQEWGELGPSLYDAYHCIEFRDRDEPKGSGEPRPRPDPPGQLLLLDREPFEGTRMLSQPQPVSTAL